MGRDCEWTGPILAVHENPDNKALYEKNHHLLPAMELIMPLNTKR